MFFSFGICCSSCVRGSSDKRGGGGGGGEGDYEDCVHTWKLECICWYLVLRIADSADASGKYVLGEMWRVSEDSFGQAAGEKRGFFSYTHTHVYTYMCRVHTIHTPKYMYL